MILWQSNVDLVVHILNGVGSNFRDIATTIRVRDMMITFEELQDKLLDHEMYLRKIDPSLDPTSITAN